ncbi:MAG: hypothetical protein ABI785_06230 [Gemmatimonadales bacterium]
MTILGFKTVSLLGQVEHRLVNPDFLFDVRTVTKGASGVVCGEADFGGW